MNLNLKYYGKYCSHISDLIQVVSYVQWEKVFVAAIGDRGSVVYNPAKRDYESDADIPRAEKQMAISRRHLPSKTAGKQMAGREMQETHKTENARLARAFSVSIVPSRLKLKSSEVITKRLNEISMVINSLADDL